MRAPARLSSARPPVFGPGGGHTSAVRAPSTDTAARPPVSFDDLRTAFATFDDARLREANLLFSLLAVPWAARVGIALTGVLLQVRLPGLQWLLKQTMFKQFCGGETMQACDRVVNELGRHGVKSILDYSVEGEKTEVGFEDTTRETLAGIEWAAQHDDIAFSVFKVTGLARFALLEKLNAGATLSADEKAEWERVRGRVERICRAAHDKGVRIFIDGEETWIQDVIDSLAEEMMGRFNRERAIVFNTWQMYRRAALGNLRASMERAAAGGWHLGAKLVRGAYMEKERARAAALGYPDPIQPDKASTDADYDAAMLLCLDKVDRVALCAGTHNEASCLLLVDELAKRGIAPGDPRVFFSQLYGMSDNISFNLAKAGYNVAKYLPYGPVRAVVPYLVRRAQENSAIAGQGGREVRLIRAELHRRRRAPALP